MTKTGYIGVDVGGTKTRLALFDATFKVLADIKLKTQESTDANAFTTALNDALTVLIHRSRRFHLEIQNVGVGCAGSFNKDGSIKDSPNIPFLTGYSFRTVIAKHTGANVMVTNDVAAGLYGEHRLGAAIGRKHVIGIFIGTGVGGALIFDGKLYRGKNGSAGDIGHYVFHKTGSAPHSQFLDDVVSRSAIAEAASELVYKKHAPYLSESVGGNPEDITAGALAESIEHGDKLVEKLVRSRCHILGVALSNLVDFLNPEMIVLGGGLSDKLPHIVRSEVEAGIRENSKQDPKRALEVVTAKLKGHAVTAGAAKLSADIALSLIAA
jgi:glucokinase